jgi:hypothetical protein
MKTSRAFMTAVPLALLLIATLAVLVAVTPGAFRFDAWPDAPRSSLSEREVVVDVPVSADGAARADARRTPSVEGNGAILAVKEPKRPVERRTAPVAAPQGTQVVADTDSGLVRDPASGGDGATSSPTPEEPVSAEAEPVPAPAPELPLQPAIPAKDLPGEPDPVLPQLESDHAARPRDLRDDQE